MPEPGDHDPALAEQERSRRFRSALRWFLAEGLAAAVGLATGIAALLFTLFPDLKPFSPTDLSAKVRVAVVEEGVTRDQWRWRLASGDAKRHAALVELDREVTPFKDDCGRGTDPGYLIYVQTEAHGFKRRQLKLRAALYDAHTGQRERVDEDHAVLAAVPVDAPTASSVQEIWLFDPRSGSRTYFARVEVFDPKEHLLDFSDSVRFPALSDDIISKLPAACLKFG